jgi:hypothetical protein
MLVSLCIDELGVTNSGRDDRADRGEELDVAILERFAVVSVLALDDERPERAGFAANGYGEKERKSFLAERVEVLVRPMRPGVAAADRAEVLDGFTGHALANDEAHLTQSRGGEADISAHDELISVALDEVERANVGIENLGDPRRRFIEKGHERHRLGRECDEVEHAVESLVSALVYDGASAPDRAGSARFRSGTNFRGHGGERVNGERGVSFEAGTSMTNDARAIVVR